MKWAIRAAAFVLMFVWIVALAYGQEDSQHPTADEIMANLSVREVQRNSAMEGYEAKRLYALDNQRLHKQAEMLVNVQYGSNGTKHFQIIAESGWSAARKHVFQRMLSTESELSLPVNRPTTLLSTVNYTFRFVKIDSVDNRPAYEIEVIPKHRSKYLIRGDIWVDAADYAIVRIDGSPAKNPSFWTRKVHFVQTYAKDGPYWFMAATHSVTEVLFLGSTSLTINYFDYKPNVFPNPAAGVSTSGSTEP